MMETLQKFVRDVLHKWLGYETISLRSASFENTVSDNERFKDGVDYYPERLKVVVTPTLILFYETLHCATSFSLKYPGDAIYSTEDSEEDLLVTYNMVKKLFLAMRVPGWGSSEIDTTLVDVDGVDPFWFGVPASGNAVRLYPEHVTRTEIKIDIEVTMDGETTQTFTQTNKALNFIEAYLEDQGIDIPQ